MCMVFTNKKSGIVDLDVSIDNQSIHGVGQIKFLVVITHNKLDWKNHVLYICGKDIMVLAL